MTSKKITESLSLSKQGGNARAASLSSEKRSEIARTAAMTRWSGEGKLTLRVAKYGTPGHPLEIKGIVIPCYVLDDGTRVLTLSGIQSGIGMASGGTSSGTSRVVVLMKSLLQKGIDIRGLPARLERPIKFILPNNGPQALGYDAMILPDICGVILDAASRGKLKKTQAKLARECATLQHAFASVGIIALIDEATGYQQVRSRNALAEILEKFVQKELRPWIKTFPPEYYEQIFKLKSWDYKEGCGSPAVLGHYTNDIVYRRLAPGVLDELRNLTPRSNSGRLKNRLFQRLTEDIGHPKLREHLVGVVMLMKYSRTWDIFMHRMDKEYPRFGASYMLPFPDDERPDA